MKTVSIPSIGMSLLAIGTMGCANLQVKEASVDGGCKNPAGGGVECDVRGTVKWGPKDPPPKDPPPGGEKIMNYIASALNTSESVPDAAMFTIDTAGSTIPYPLTGTVLVKLIRSSDGKVFASKSFPWTRTGTIIRFTDPDAVNNWAYAYSGSADTFSYDTNDFPSNFSGNKTMKITQKYESVVQASETTTVNGGPTCTNYPSPYPCSGNQ